MPGRLNTFSTSTAPAIRKENCRPMMVTIGTSELRTACRQSTWPAVNPFARAVRMKSSPVTSSPAERVTRVRTAAWGNASATAGSRRDLMAAAGSLQPGKPPAENQCSVVEKSRMKRIPNQKSGTDMPISAKVDAARSGACRGCAAKRHADCDGDRHRHQGERQRDLQPLRDQRGDRHAIGGGLAEIPGKGAPDPGEIADIGRLIETKLAFECCDGVRLRRGSKQDRRGISRQQVQRREDDQRRREKSERERGKAAENEAKRLQIF